MKKIYLATILSLALSSICAQGPTVVLSQNKCDYGKIAAINQSMSEIGAPVLDRLVEEGKLLNWGVLEHSWGDEWNWNIYYVARDLPTFLSSWDEYVQGATANGPAFIEEFWSACSEHKDAIYNETSGYNHSGSGPKLKSMTMFNLPEGITMAAVQESLNTANKAIAEMGYWGNGYKLYNVTDPAIQELQVLVEGTWLNQEAYDMIHASEAWLEATSVYGEMWDKIMAQRTYRRYTLHE